VQNMNLALGWAETAGLPVAPGAMRGAAVRA
jgi:N-acetyl-gamma-glutamylphosphate reductase